MGEEAARSRHVGCQEGVDDLKEENEKRRRGAMKEEVGEA